jgi:hypothetical protein
MRTARLRRMAILAAMLSATLAAGSAFGQVIIDNPAKPKNKRAGRTVALEEAMRIRDDGANIVFRNPRNLTLLGNGSLVFSDEPHLYVYDKDGKLVFKALKQGTGPGESLHPDHHFVQGERISFYSWIPPKLLGYDFRGRYLGETKTAYLGPFSFLDLVDGKVFGIRDEIRFTEFIHQEGFFETPYTLYEVSPNFEGLKKILDIPIQHYIKKAHWWRRAMFVAVPWEHFLFVVHTSEYRIDKLDLRAGRIERSFKRRFTRVRSGQEETAQDPYEQVPRQLLPPPLDYDFDIYWIQVFRNQLWVFTSKTKDNDGVSPLVDVFDMDGRYVDCFFMVFPKDNENRWVFDSLASDDGHVFVKQEDKVTGLISIGKCRIRDEFSQ